MGPGQDFTSVFGWALIGVLVYVLLLMLWVVWIYFRNFFFAAEVSKLLKLQFLPRPPSQCFARCFRCFSAAFQQTPAQHQL